MGSCAQNMILNVVIYTPFVVHFQCRLGPFSRVGSLRGKEGAKSGLPQSIITTIPNDFCDKSLDRNMQGVQSLSPHPTTTMNTQ